MSDFKKEIANLTEVLKDNLYLFDEWNKVKTPENVKDWLTEESAELLVAMCHFYRGRVSNEQVTEEFVDALICMVQLALNAGCTGLGEMMQKKLDKAKVRMQNG